MDIRFGGTGGPAGWPEPGCRCASCLRVAAAGPARRPSAVLVDGHLQITPGQPPRRAGTDGTAGGASQGASFRVGGHQIAAVPGGWDITGPDGARLLAAAEPGALPDPPAGTGPFDVLLLDLLASPAQLGDLRSRGLARPDSTAVALYADHRIATAAELTRRCGYWRALAPADGDAVSTVARWLARPPGRLPHRTLVLGGARSGKSREAELRLAAEPAVTYLAAGPYPDRARDPGPDRAEDAGPGPAGGAQWAPDAEWTLRVAAHQAARPRWWSTVESTDVAGALLRLTGAVLIDGIGTWLTAVMTEAGAWDAGPASAAGRAASAQVSGRVAELISAWRQTGARVVAVSDQVGSGVVPATAAGRTFRDQLGWLNQRLAAESEETSLVVAGRVREI
jgi:adenosylcobinamide kinase / adenosylcobinamide-phosphate guanylyltransferase